MTAVHIADESAEPGRDATLASLLAAPLPDLETEDDSPGNGLLYGLFLRAHLHGLHPYLVEQDLRAALDVTTALPAGAVLIRLHRRNSYSEALAECRDCLVLLRCWKSSADVWVSGPDRELVEDLVATVASQVPEPPRDESVRVTFWHSSRTRWSRARNIEVPSWADVSRMYPASVRGAVTELMSYRPSSTSAGGRLIVWHGPPGTGKTTAVRALLDAWRDWADPHVVADPERLLNDGDYMARVLIDTADTDEPGRWRLVVIEDAEELLRRDARRQVGAALGRLLNSADGMLGQGSNALILLTTNERVDEMHPAVLRPGRCLARIEFPAFTAAEASELAGQAVNGPLTLAEVIELRGDLTRLHVVSEPAPVGQYL